MEIEFFDVDKHWKHYANEPNSLGLEEKRRKWNIIKKTNIIQDLKKYNVKPETKYPSDEYVYRKYNDVDDYPRPAPNKNTFYDIAKITEEQLIELLIN